MHRPIDIDRDALARWSRFVDDSWNRWPDAPGPEDPVEPPGQAAMAADPEASLRRFRQLASTHILWRDLRGEASIEETGRAISRLACDCIERALRSATDAIETQFGVLRDPEGETIHLTVLGLGKLGGDELNFNSDIDLVFVYRNRGQSDGRRPLDAAAYLKRVVVEMIRLLDSVMEQGRAWIVDTRLRPFGQAGSLVWSRGAIEQYFLNEARTWERYAWMKARPVAGDLDTGQQFLDTIRPFIFRRYLDFGIFSSLRDLHQQIDAKSRQDSRREDIKRGAGGIRELEFLIQSQQMLRGGRDPDLRAPGFLPALRALTRARILSEAESEQLAESYGFLRILENRLQAASGQQTHHLPDQQEERERLVQLMGSADWPALLGELNHHREHVRAHFSSHFDQPEDHELGVQTLWPPGDDLDQQLRTCGFDDPAGVAALLRGLNKRIGNRALSAQGRSRLERLMPRLLDEVTRHPDPETGLSDLLQLIDQISRRSAYLALLHERPATMKRLVEVFRYSDRLADWIVASPQLLDDLLDPIHGLELPAAPRIDQDDVESSLFALGHWRQAGFLRTALAEMDGALDAAEAADQLSQVASVCVEKILELLGSEAASLAVIAYGNLGAGLLHFDSDLDLVFLHAEGASPRRAAQRFISYMQLPLPGGRLFEIDTRLRPNGNAGTLVSSLDHFAHYQSSQALHWEHQALIRARWISGFEPLADDFEGARISVLESPRDDALVRKELADMRQRQRSERHEDPIKALLTDLQFIAECGVLCQAHEQPGLMTQRRPDHLLTLLGASAWIDSDLADQLSAAWKALLSHRHKVWLSRHPTDALPGELSATIQRAWREVFAASF
ncbi:MAG: bifunctional [glutamate--ammonia ligase]-adenylyl-L-tyrosine phosphorylase/[glutamate--ammonia-ligase] adenylyltransferase [Pseudomonadota bacterium]